MLPQLPKRDRKINHNEDFRCRLAIEALTKQNPSLLLKSSVTDSKIVHREWNCLQMQEDHLYRRGPSKDSKEKWQLFLLEKHRLCRLLSMMKMDT